MLPLQTLTTAAAAMVIGCGNNICMKLHLNYHRLLGGLSFHSGKTFHCGSDAVSFRLPQALKWLRQAMARLAVTAGGTSGGKLYDDGGNYDWSFWNDVCEA